MRPVVICACGCGNPVKTARHGSKFCHGHNQRVRPSQLKKRRNLSLALYLITGGRPVIAQERFKINQSNLKRIARRELRALGLR